MTTERRLIEAAGQLLDTGGEGAVTLRAVSQAVGISHNAPYRHFRSRDMLLAAVAAADFAEIAVALSKIRHSDKASRQKLTAALDVLIAYAQARPARYRLLFHNPHLSAESAELEKKGAESISEFFGIVAECQASKVLPGSECEPLAGVLLAAMHGLLALEANGQLTPRKGLKSVADSMTLLLDLLAGTLAGDAAAKA
ncbi:TetR/AcrR family transcriptional regulator [Luteimonas sp. FCS-9]|uniref:TetR/AcrR family transcriptional regulator n=1 Tax=Luteimonas sp. FCS-9 TaxID=1547516 RepID=UPI00063ED2B2|nr:TetR/AcrR family transcriptional regulator [Luteimonas sp. FCS-9]KLJ00830.1 hypothetical protein WQ56_08665 [Luteimonas sp. FCS-9]